MHSRESELHLGRELRQQIDQNNRVHPAAQRHYQVIPRLDLSAQYFFYANGEAT
jgi:hypothetical protein